MSCGMVEKWLSAFLDRALPRNEAESVSQHLSGCRECAARLKELVELRTLLRGLPEERIPVNLASQLQVMASREQARRTRTRWQNYLSWMRLVIDNMMRPVAIPLAGGITAALV